MSNGNLLAFLIFPGVSQMAVCYLERGVITQERVPRAIANALQPRLDNREKAIDVWYEQ